MTDQLKQSIKIGYIGHHNQHIPVIAQWHQDEWQHISPDLTTKKRIQLYQTYTNTNAIPHCLAALIDNAVVGSASIVECDMDTHSYLTPWLASVFVCPLNRRRGIASQLIDQCLSNAYLEGFNTIYLFTPNQMQFYQARGWKLVEHCRYHNEEVDIMSYDLTSQFT